MVRYMCHKCNSEVEKFDTLYQCKCMSLWEGAVIPKHWWVTTGIKDKETGLMVKTDYNMCTCGTDSIGGGFHSDWCNKGN